MFCYISDKALEKYRNWKVKDSHKKRGVSGRRISNFEQFTQGEVQKVVAETSDEDTCHGFCLKQYNFRN